MSLAPSPSEEVDPAVLQAIRAELIEIRATLQVILIQLKNLQPPFPPLPSTPPSSAPAHPAWSPLVQPPPPSPVLPNSTNITLSRTGEMQ